MGKEEKMTKEQCEYLMSAGERFRIEENETKAEKDALFSEGKETLRKAKLMDKGKQSKEKH